MRVDGAEVGSGIGESWGWRGELPTVRERVWAGKEQQQTKTKNCLRVSKEADCRRIKLGVAEVKLKFNKLKKVGVEARSKKSGVFPLLADKHKRLLTCKSYSHEGVECMLGLFE